MNFKKICYACMQEKPSETAPCPHCGFSNQTYSVPQNHLLPLTPLNGKYLVGKSIGQGGFGITYIAFDMQLQVVVAIKELFLRHIMSRAEDGRTVVIPDEKAKALEVNKNRFLREARVLAMFNEQDNDGIVNVRDHFEENGTAYIVMNYLHGITLKDYVKQHGKLSFEETKKLLDPVGHALSKVHEFNVIHKDVSPDNIMVLSDGNVKLMDFGGFSTMYQDSEDSIISYKRGYAPPEQYTESGKISPATDVYALAATIYYCLTGTKPPEAMDRRVGNDITLPTKIGVKLDPAVEAALMKALSLDIKDRPRTMAEFQDSLNVRTKKRGIVSFAALAAIVAVVVLGVVVFTPKKTNGTANKTLEAAELSAEGEDGKAESSSAEGSAEETAYEVGEIIPYELGTYIFENYADSNYIMGIDSGFGDDGADLVLKSYYDSNQNRIMVTDSGDGFYNLQAAHTNSYIQTLESQELGTKLVQLAELVETGTEKWCFVYCGNEDGKDVVILQNAAGSVLAPQDGVVAEGTSVVLAEKNLEDDTQKWYVRWSEKDTQEADVIVYHEGDFVETMEGVHSLASAYDGETMCSVSRYEELTEPEIIVWENVWDATQQFNFVLQEESRYKIYPVDQLEGENKCLEYNEENEKIVLRDESDSENQLFRVVYTGYNMYLIQAYNESVLGYDRNEDDSAEGNAIFARPYEAFEDSRQEKWLFEAVE